MQRAGSIVLFSLLRLAFFLLPLALLWWLLGTDWIWFSAVCAALIGVALSLLVLSPLRERYSEALAEALHGGSEAAASEDPAAATTGSTTGRRARRAPSDEAIEDAALGD